MLCFNNSLAISQLLIQFKDSPHCYFNNMLNLHIVKCFWNIIISGVSQPSQSFLVKSLPDSYDTINFIYLFVYLFDLFYTLHQFLVKLFWKFDFFENQISMDNFLNSYYLPSLGVNVQIWRVINILPSSYCNQCYYTTC